MSTIAWDSDTMRETSDMANEKAENMESALNHLRTKLESQLASWDGDAANTMKETINVACDNILAYIDFERAVAAYNTKAADTFDECEDMLASLEI